MSPFLFLFLFKTAIRGSLFLYKIGEIFPLSISPCVSPPRRRRIVFPSSASTLCLSLFRPLPIPPSFPLTGRGQEIFSPRPSSSPLFLSLDGRRANLFAAPSLYISGGWQGFVFLRHPPLLSLVLGGDGEIRSSPLFSGRGRENSFHFQPSSPWIFMAPIHLSIGRLWIENEQVPICLSIAKERRLCMACEERIRARNRGSIFKIFISNWDWPVESIRARKMKFGL